MFGSARVRLATSSRDADANRDRSRERVRRTMPNAESGRRVGARDSKQSDLRSLVARARGTPRVVGAPSEPALGAHTGAWVADRSGALLEPCHIAHGPFGCSR